AANRDRQLRLARVRHSRDDVVVVERTDDERRTPVEDSVERRSRRLVPGVRRRDHRTAVTKAEVVDGRGDDHRASMTRGFASAQREGEDWHLGGPYLHNAVPVAKRASLVVVLALTLLISASADAGGSGSAAPGGATATAYGIKVIVPGQAGGATPTVSAPPDAVQFSGGFSYGSGATGALVSTGSA